MFDPHSRDSFSMPHQFGKCMVISVELQMNIQNKNVERKQKVGNTHCQLYHFAVPQKSILNTHYHSLRIPSTKRSYASPVNVHLPGSTFLAIVISSYTVWCHGCNNLHIKQILMCYWDEKNVYPILISVNYNYEMSKKGVLGFSISYLDLEIFRFFDICKLDSTWRYRLT